MTTPTDRDAVTAVISRLIDAWGRHDAGAYGAEFTEDATYTTFIGTYYQGRAAIVQSHRILFAKFLKGTKLAEQILDVRFVGADTVVVTGRGDTYKGTRPSKLSKVQTYTLVRQRDGVWRVAAFHNTKHKALMEAISFKFAPGLNPATLK